MDLVFLNIHNMEIATSILDDHSQRQFNFADLNSCQRYLLQLLHAVVAIPAKNIGDHICSNLFPTITIVK